MNRKGLGSELSSYGEDGWELISCAPDINLDNELYQAIFKRRIYDSDAQRYEEINIMRLEMISDKLRDLIKAVEYLDK